MVDCRTSHTQRFRVVPTALQDERTTFRTREAVTIFGTRTTREDTKCIINTDLFAFAGEDFSLIT